MKFLQVARFDDSDDHVYSPAAQVDELAVTGSFVFSFAEEDPASLSGKAALAFRNGFLGLDSFGWATVVRIVEVSDEQYEQALQRLAQHFVMHYGAPSVDQALPVARQEIEYASGLCEHPPGTLLTVERHAENGEIHESFKRVQPRETPVADWQGKSGEVRIWDMFPETDSKM
jgi:hypothetical protein